MPKLSPLLQIGLCTFGYLCTTGSRAIAQVTSDNTVNTQVNQNGNVAEITGGETRGSNLFHSFQDFSVPTGNEAFFNNAESIANIFSRVTGGNISDIDGAIRANDSASLFLINPAGIIFGENASLNLGGSFYGSTADSILFEDGELSAVDNLQQSLLTINAPIGLSFRDEPGDIVNRSRFENSSEEIIGLEVASGQTLALVGGDINFESGEATASGGNIYLGGLAEAGIVDFNEDGSLGFPQNITLANIILTNAARVVVGGTGRGSVTVDARNLTLEAGEFGISVILAGISPESTDPEAQAGNAIINVAENITLNNSAIANQVAPEAIGNSGNIIINAGSLELINGGRVDASTFGIGNAGAVKVTATGDITADGEDSDGFSSGIASFVSFDAEGDAGGVTVSTNNLNLTNGGRVDASTFGIGNAGAVTVNATGDITAEGSGIASSVFPSAEGNSGGVDVTTTNLNLTNGGRVDASTFGIGNAGVVEVTATGDITADGESLDGFSSGIASSVELNAEGDAGGVTVTTTNLNLTNGGRVDASTFGIGNAGAVTVNATGDITAEGSGIASSVFPSAEGNSGGVDVTTTNLNLTNGGRVDASTFGAGSAGDVKIDASKSISIDGVIEDSRSGITANAQNENGNGGDILIATGGLTIANGGTIEATNFDTLGVFNPGTGKPGNINITANSIDLTDSARIEVTTQFAGANSGIIDLNVVKDITLRNNSFISARAIGNADGGNISIDSRYLLAFPSELSGDGNDLLASSEFGNGGNISITTQSNGIFGLEVRPAIPGNRTNDIDVSGMFDFVSLQFIFPPDTQPPINPIEPEQTIAQACRADRVAAAQNIFSIEGRGGIISEPGLPLDSSNIYVNGENDSTSTIPAPIETAQGKIQPARGIKVTEDGTITLTAYRTNNVGDRLPEVKSNCG